MYSAIIVAGGVGIRSGLPHNKVLYEIHGKPLIQYVLEYFDTDEDCAEIILVTHRRDIDLMCEKFGDIVEHIVSGGVTRQESVLAGLEVASNAYVFIHDGARPFVPDLTELKVAVQENKAASLAISVFETVKRTKDGMFIEDVDRRDLVLVQTPQAFERRLLLEAYSKAASRVYTCDASLVSSVLHYPVQMAVGSRKNIKFTTQDDAELLKLILS